MLFKKTDNLYISYQFTLNFKLVCVLTWRKLNTMVYVNTASSYRKMKRKSLADFTEFVSVKISDTAIVNCNLKYISIAILITHSRPIRLHFRFWSFPILILCLLFHKSDLAIVGELKLKLFFRALLNIKYKVKTLQCFFKHVVPENFPQNICCSSTTTRLQDCSQRQTLSYPMDTDVLPRR